MTEKPMVILTGPTAVGKTALSIRLAQQIGGAIISADSMQVYRHMDIGSAKIRQSEMQGIPHYLIDALEPDEDFHVVRFVELAKAALEEIYRNGQIPIVTGGTGFYIQALLYDIDFSEQECDTEYRRKLEALAAEKGAAYLHEMLRQADPASAEAIHTNNVKRTIRALEFYHLSGEKISEHNEEERRKTSPYNFAYFVLNDERSRLYARIEKRVDEMLDEGLVAEVSRLREMGLTREMVSMQGLGYKEILSYLEGEISLERAVYLIKRDTRHFAKRQLTWFRRERDVIWLDKDRYAYQEDAILSDMLAILKEKHIVREEWKQE
ncbi:MAG: tRNA (adenosine(37)-N6)-dimethylallyltransferase MiaA [Roseburia sp.]